jgi:putative DeoR family transcriptional regulator (stage III sporulation protein D)
MATTGIDLAEMEGLRVKGIVEERAIELGSYIVEHQATVRAAAKKFGVSKSTVHMDVNERLQRLHPQLYCQVRHVLDVNKSERHIRGGLATREKYRMEEESSF